MCVCVCPCSIISSGLNGPHPNIKPLYSWEAEKCNYKLKSPDEALCGGLCMSVNLPWCLGRRVRACIHAQTHTRSSWMCVWWGLSPLHWLRVNAGFWVIGCQPSLSLSPHTVYVFSVTELMSESDASDAAGLNPFDSLSTHNNTRERIWQTDAEAFRAPHVLDQSGCADFTTLLEVTGF